MTSKGKRSHANVTMSSLSLHSHSSEYVSSEAYCTNFGTLDPLSEPDVSWIASFGVTEHMLNKV